MAVATTQTTREERSTALLGRALLVYLSAPKTLLRVTIRLRIGTVLFALGGLAEYGIATAYVWQNWTSQVWPGDPAFVTVAIAIGWFAWICALFAYARVPRAAQTLSTQLHQTMTSAASDTFPVTPMQPSPFAASDLPMQPLRIAPLRGPIDGRRVRRLRFGALLGFLAGIPILLIGILFGLTLLVLPPADTASYAQFTVGVTIVCFAIAVIYLFPGIRNVWRARALVRGFTVDADTQGLRWRDITLSTGEYQLRWDEVSAFFVARLGGVRNLAPCLAYILVGEHATLTWSVSQVASAVDVAASDYLCRLVATRSGVALRDCTEQVASYAIGLSVFSAALPQRRVNALLRRGAIVPHDVVTPTAMAHARALRVRRWVAAAVIALATLVLWSASLVIQSR